MLLWIMALMLNFGTAATWKVRAQVVARHAAWANRWPRDMNDLPRPTVTVNFDQTPPARIAWPTSAGMGTGGSSPIAQLDDPRIQHPVVRGPLPTANIDPDMYNLMTMSHGANQGYADIQRDYPLLRKMLGEYHLQAQCPLLDNDWRYQRIPWDTEVWYWSGWHNEHRRIPVIYDLGFLAPQTDLLESLYQDPGYQTAFFAMSAGLNWSDFMAMGGPDLYGRDIRDDEDLFYENFFPQVYTDPDGVVQNIAFGRHHYRSGASLRRFCSLDEADIQRRVEDLIDRIEGDPDRNIRGIPEQVARQYRNLYNAVIWRFNHPKPNDPKPTSGEISTLEKKRDAADRFIQSLQNQ